MEMEIKKMGIAEYLAISLTWEKLSHDEKNNLSLRQCLEAWKLLPRDNAEKEEVWYLIKSKVKTFDNGYYMLRHLWKIAALDSKTKVAVWELAKSRAKTFQDNFYIWEEFMKNSPKKMHLEGWIFIKSKINNFEESFRVWDTMFSCRYAMEEDAWQLLKKKADNFKNLEKILFRISDTCTIKVGNKRQEEVYDLMEKKAKTFDEILDVWELTRPESEKRAQIWKRLRKKINNYSDIQAICFTFQKSKLPESDAYKLLIEKAGCLRDHIDNWKMTDSRHPVRDVAWQKVVNQMKEFRKIKSFWEYEFENLKNSEKNSLIKVMINSAKDQDELQEVWTIVHTRKSERDKNFVWEKLKQGATNIDDLQWMVYYTAPGSKREEAWKMLKEKTDNI